MKIRFRASLSFVFSHLFVFGILFYFYDYSVMSKLKGVGFNMKYRHLISSKLRVPLPSKIIKTAAQSLTTKYSEQNLKLQPSIFLLVPVYSFVFSFTVMKIPSLHLSFSAYHNFAPLSQLVGEITEQKALALYVRPCLFYVSMESVRFFSLHSKVDFFSKFCL